MDANNPRSKDCRGTKRRFGMDWLEPEVGRAGGRGGGGRRQIAWIREVGDRYNVQVIKCVECGCLCINGTVTEGFCWFCWFEWEVYILALPFCMLLIQRWPDVDIVARARLRGVEGRGKREEFGWFNESVRNCWFYSFCGAQCLPLRLPPFAILHASCLWHGYSYLDRVSSHLHAH